MFPQPNNNQAATTNYNQAVAEFGSVYDPQVAAVHAQADQALQTKNTALAQLGQDNATKLSQLDQAKANAFSNNALTANARGLNFSGYAPAQNTAYTTSTYNPNVQAQNTAYQRSVDSTNTDYNSNYQSLQDKITQLNQQRANDAYSLVQNTRQAQAQAAKEAAAAATAASNKTNSANYVQGSKGQYQFVDNTGKSINLQQYVDKTGGDINTVLGLLQGGTSYDKNIYNKVLAAKPANATAALNLIRQLSQKANASGTGTTSVYGF